MDTTMTKDSLDRLLRSGLRRIKTTDLGRVVRRSRTFKRLVRGPLADIASDVQLLYDLVRDYLNGSYRDVPKRTVFAAAVALLYVLNPFDLIPDYIPGIGYLDDSAMVMFVIGCIRQDLDDYRTWGQKLAKRLRHFAAESL